MARRAGKAAHRKARQRKAQRAAAAPPSTVSAAAGPSASPSAAAGPTAGPAASVTTPPKRAPAPKHAPAHGNLIASSQLTAAERSEYHYVERDLRDIGILTAVMTVLLLVAWFAFRALGVLG